MNETKSITYGDIENLWKPEHRPYLNIDLKHGGRKALVTVGTRSNTAIAVFNKEGGRWVEAAGLGGLETDREIPPAFNHYMNDTCDDDLIAQVTQKLNLSSLPYYLPDQVRHGEIEIAHGSVDGKVELFKWTGYDPVCLVQL